MNQSLIGWVFILIYLTIYISYIKFFLYLNIFSVINFLHVCLTVVGLKFYLVLVTSAHYCWLIMLLLVFDHQLIITLNLRFLKIFFHKWHQRFLMLRRIIGLGCKSKINPCFVTFCLGHFQLRLAVDFLWLTNLVFI